MWLGLNVYTTGSAVHAPKSTILILAGCTIHNCLWLMPVGVRHQDGTGISCTFDCALLVHGMRCWLGGL